MRPNTGDGGPHAFEVRNGVGIAPSSFGMAATTLGPEYGADGIWNSARKQELEFRQRYYRCTSHDWKSYDFGGRMISSGRQSMTQPLMSQSSATPDYYVPMSARRPSVPYRLARKMTGAFTGLLFGHGRWPQMRSDDPDTQAWAEAIAKAGKLQGQLTQARNLGGSTGTAGISWRWVGGKPRFKAHDAAYVHVLEWEDEDEKIPSHVTKLKQRMHTVTDEKTGRPKEVAFWYREDWTLVADVVFKPAEVTDDEPDWARYIDEEQSEEHRHGRCHFVWVQNLPCDDVEAEDDGQTDYAEVYEPLDSLDILNSVLHKGTVLNLDPTLVIKADEENDPRGVVKKGSDNAILPGLAGDAKYLELSGMTVEAGIKLVDKEKEQILETCECVLLDPDKAAASGQSSVAMRIVYAPMIGKADLMRGSYGGAIERLLNDVTDYARMYLPDEPGQLVVEDVLVENDNADDPDAVPVYEDREVEFFVDLPPRVTTTPRLDSNGDPVMGEDGKPVEDETREEQHPGAGAITIEWGEYFKATADDLQKMGQAISTAAGAKACLSQRTAVELTANAFNRDPNQEWEAVQLEVAQERTHEAAVSAGLLPSADANPEVQAPGGGGYSRAKGSYEIDDQIKQLLTVRAALALVGQPPLLDPDTGLESEDNDMTIVEFQAKAAAKGTAEGTIDGGGAPPAPPALPGTLPAPGENPGSRPGDDDPPEPTPFAPRD